MAAKAAVAANIAARATSANNILALAGLAALAGISALVALAAKTFPWILLELNPADGVDTPLSISKDILKYNVYPHIE